MFKVGQKQERWLPIKGYGCYRISDRGSIINTVTGKQLKPTKFSYGYLMIRLTENKQAKSFTVHRLVAQHFLPNPYNFPLVCHKDDDKTNPSANNLFWGTHKHNSEDMVNKGRSAKGEKSGN